MSISVLTILEPRASRVQVGEDSLVVDLVDGRTLMVPIAWYPRLAHGSLAERKKFELLGDGVGIHWPDLDEDISVEGLIAGLPSRESQHSLKRWIEARSRPNAKRRPATARARGHAARTTSKRAKAHP